MDNVTKKKKFNKRAFISISLFLSFLLLPISGLMNHNLQSEALTVERHFWMTIHNISSILFAIFTILHINNNWRVLINHVKKGKGIISREAFFALILITLVVVVFSRHVFLSR
jgi:hypothetical protein